MERTKTTGAAAFGLTVPLRPLRPAIARLIALMLRTWPERQRQRARLLELEPRLLEDASIDPADAVREGRKPFWR